MVLDLASVRKASVKESPYPYFVATEALASDVAADVASAFPNIDRPGAIPANDTAYGASFGTLLNELRSDEFRQLISEKLDVDLSGKEVIINVRGQTRWSDGNIHTDTPSKLVTVLLYFNAPGEALQATGLRILRNGRDIDDFAEEIPPLLGTMVAFKVTPDCWHGFKPFNGARHSLQLNYLSGIKTKHKHEAGRRFVRHAGRRAGRVAGSAQAALQGVERDAGALWLAAWEPRTPWYVKLIAGVAAAFAISPIDFSPDVIPVVGHLDDIILLAFGTFLTARLIPRPLMAELRARAAAMDFMAARRGAAALSCIWLAAAGMALARAKGLA
jgi:SM-20-related protein